MASKVWETMNDLEMTTAKIVSAREIIDAAIDRLQEHQYDKAETMIVAAYEFLEYYLNEFDEKFKLAWKETVVKQDENEWNSFWDGKDPVTGYNYQGSTVSSVKYTDEELDAMCDKAASDQLPPQQEYLGWKNVSSAEFNKMFPKKWVLPVQQECVDGDYYVNFPEDLLEKANLNEGDQVEWIDKGDGSYIMKKVEKINLPNHDDMIAAGYTMSADGFWFKE